MYTSQAKQSVLLKVLEIALVSHIGAGLVVVQKWVDDPAELGRQTNGKKEVSLTDSHMPENDDHLMLP